MATELTNRPSLPSITLLILTSLVVSSCLKTQASSDNSDNSDMAQGSYPEDPQYNNRGMYYDDGTWYRVEDPEEFEWKDATEPWVK